MIKFSCPDCDKALRADDSRAGSVVKCPACGQRLTVPNAEAEPPPPEADEEERPEPRKKKRPRSRRRPPDAAAEQGKVFVIIIICIVLGMHLISVVQYLLMPDPVQMAKQQSSEIYKSLGKDLPKGFEQKMEQDLDKLMSSKDVQAAVRRSKWTGWLWLLVSPSLSLVLLVFLYLRHDWARVVLGVLFLIGGFLGLIGLVLGGLAVLSFLSVGAALLTILEMAVRLGVNFGIGFALMKSESIAAYTAGR
jgi:hypothetical protein